MPAEDQASGTPPVQYVCLMNISWMNCILFIDYEYDKNTGEFKNHRQIEELTKDNSCIFDLSSLEKLGTHEKIKPLDVVRVRIQAAQPQTAAAIRFNPNKQRATYQFKGTLGRSWLEKI